jgi:hypothetical protein
VGVSAKNALSLALFCMAERALCYLRSKAQPSCVETVKVAGKTFAAGIDLLQPEKDELSQARELEIPDGEAVKLVAVDRQVALAGIVPRVFLIDRDAHQVRHDFREAVVMIALDPDDFNLMPRVGELADEAEKLPVLAGEAAEVQVGEDIAQQDEPAEMRRLQELKGVRSAAHLRPEVEIGNDDGVNAFFLHAPNL